MMPLPPFEPTETPDRFTFQLPADHPAFQGHFPDRPILPGVVQVDWAIRMGERVFGPLGAFTEVSQLKFTRLIQPEETVALQLAFDPTRRALAFTYEGPEGRAATGTVRFRESA